MRIQEPIDRQKQLNIIAIVDPSDYGQSALHHGEKLAQVFSATLTVVPHFGFSMEQKKEPDEPVIATTGEILNEYFFPETLYAYAEKKNTIMFVIGVDSREKKGLFNKRKAIRFIKDSRLPVMTVGTEMPTDHAYEQVVLPIDIERQAKEKALWAGYFSRFYHATIHILQPTYSDTGLAKQVGDNIAFVEKLYENLEIQSEIHPISPVQNVDLHSIEFAATIGATLTVITMTKYFTFGDLLTGPHEKKVIGNAQGFPVLCINQRDDLYVLCT
ncbi:MAG: hypothetical protein MJZ57_02655 [Bacteroidales bacterium]|nr:hypothetical protein [Bacteroidales bacterium]